MFILKNLSLQVLFLPEGPQAGPQDSLLTQHVCFVLCSIQDTSAVKGTSLLWHFSLAPLFLCFHLKKSAWSGETLTLIKINKRTKSQPNKNIFPQSREAF